MRAERPSIFERLELLIRSAATDADGDTDPLVEGASLLLETVVKLDAELSEVRRALAEKHDLLESLRSRAYRDSLTGLMNRWAFDEAMSRSLGNERSSDRTSAVIVLDVDNFKSINDRHGHAAGDAVLREVGAILRNTLPGADVVSRIGGEEFCAILSDTGLVEASRLAEFVREAIENARHSGDEAPFRVTASLGVAISTGAIDSAAVQHADRALYAAKRAGRNRVFVFHDGTCQPTRLRPPVDGETSYRRFTRFLTDGLVVQIRSDDGEWHSAWVLDESVSGIAVYCTTLPFITTGAELLLDYRDRRRHAQVKRVIPESPDEGIRLIGLQWCQRAVDEDQMLQNSSTIGSPSANRS